jgi:3D (Asp-Asp-Asp) domain-containing protein
MRRFFVVLTLLLVLIRPVATTDPAPPHQVARVVPAIHGPPEVSRGGSRPVLRHIEVLVTAYCQGTITATGVRVHRGIVAVDPAVIPLHSTVFVPGYGWARAEDTGGLIHGDRVDVYIPELKAAVKWGAQKLEVTVLETSSGRR